MPVDWRGIEEKWRSRWEAAHLFEADPDSTRPKYFLTVAYPYPNSPQHIGHGRTYTLADVHARYLRMKGYNVLLPMAFHYTGTPILAMAKRLAEKDPELLDTFTRIYRVPESVLNTLSDPLLIARYFHEEIKAGMKEIGYSIDWRREFTTIDPTYRRFIEWQFKKLHDQGLITQGSHPVGWCPKDGSPVGQHDTMGDVEPEIGEYTTIKFPFEGAFLPAATLRPETVFGVTNMWLNPEAEYVEHDIDGERWIISAESAAKMRHLGFQLTETRRFKGAQLIGHAATNPVTGGRLPILPASFVDPKSATGVVMSVPAHAPYDQQALFDLAGDEETLRRFRLDVPAVRAIGALTIIRSEGYSDNPALALIQRMKINRQDDPRLEEATSELYSHEFHLGTMLDSAGKYARLPVSEARDRVKEDLLAARQAFILPEILNRPVICRCGTECVVKLFENQWFINYGDADWKRLASDCLRQMTLLPEDIRGEFEYTIGWLRQKACARRSGLGTPLPWDQDWIIESLSDSVIYMAYYTIAKHLRQNGVPESQLSEAVFDYLFLGQGDLSDVSRTSSLDPRILGQMRDEFAYFYPLDSRHSGRDLVPNHLTFFTFNHAAIFPRDLWPRQIVVNGSVLMEGKKMSKSFGNIVPLRGAIDTYGADPLRLTLMATAELLQDADVSLETVRHFQDRLEKLHEMTLRLAQTRPADRPQYRLIDRWLLSRLQTHVTTVSEALEKLRVREAIHHAVYLLDQDIQWYLRRTEAEPAPGETRSASSVLRTTVKTKVLLMAPFTPHVCEELWSLLGETGFVSKAPWPQPDDAKRDAAAEDTEEFVRSLLEDTNNIQKVVKVKPHRIVFYTASPWKWQVYLDALRLVEKGPLNPGTLIRKLMEDPDLKARAKDVSTLASKVAADVTTLPAERRLRRLSIGILDEGTVIRGAADFLARELEAPIDVYGEEDGSRHDPRNRASGAKPYRPAIYIE